MNFIQRFADAVASLFDDNRTTTQPAPNNTSAAYALSRTYAPGRVKSDTLPTRYSTPRELATIGYFTLNAPEQAPRNDGDQNIPPWLAGSPLAGVLGGLTGGQVASNFADVFAQFNTPAAPIFTVPVTPVNTGPTTSYNPVAPTLNLPSVDIPPVTGLPNSGNPFYSVPVVPNVDNYGLGSGTAANAF